jgi:hypothetical protein
LIHFLSALGASPIPPKSFERLSLTRLLTYLSTLLLAAIDYYYQPRPSGDDDPVFGEFWEEEWLSHPLLQTLLVFSYIYASEEGSARIEGIKDIKDMETLLGLRASRQPRAE